MAKETLTEVIAVAETESAITKPKTSPLEWVAENGIFVFTGLLILASVVFVDGFASLVNITDVFHRAAPIGIVAVGITNTGFHWRCSPRYLPRLCLALSTVWLSVTSKRTPSS